ncbi:MAG: biotin--[acetyl-CoA-carboxylase] ligase [bacterium]|nr:biotin--[acetyl-CoA-carboxylase] ligase [bacterium]
MEEIGRSIIRLESADSTNNYTANRARENDLRHGAVILAVEQTRGKGQMGAHWQSNAGENLTFSVFLNNVNLSVQRQFLLTKIVSLSLVDLLSKFGVSAEIKWPNDIYVADKKIAGALIENVIHGKTITKSIIGIGLNINQRDFGALSATSLSLEKEMHYSLDDVLFSFVAAFNNRLKMMESRTIHDDYHHLLYRLDEKHRFEDSEGVFEGVIKGTTDSGLLIVNRHFGSHQQAQGGTAQGSDYLHIERNRDAQKSIDHEYHLKEIKFLI